MRRRVRSITHTRCVANTVRAIITVTSHRESQQLTPDAPVRLWIDKSITAQTAGQQLDPIKAQCACAVESRAQCAAQLTVIVSCVDSALSGGGDSMLCVLC